MLVTCRICKNKIQKENAFKIDGKTPKYYCSQTEFEAEEERKKKAQEDKDRVYRLICNIMGVNEILNTALWKEKLEWNKAFSDEFIAKYLEEKKDYLSSAIARLSGTEYAKIRYISTVLKNSLRDFKPKVIEVTPPKVVVEEHYETKYKPKTRRALLDFEEDC